MNGREDTLGRHPRATGERCLFHNRTDAGARLAATLDHLRGHNALVLGVTRGGVPVAFEVARRLDADLDVFVARKLGLPGQQELAMGAVTSDGTCYVDRELVVQFGISDASLAHVARSARTEAQRRELLFRDGRPAKDVAGRVVVVVDDGLATGAMMKVAVRSLLRRKPKRLIVAAPVGAPEACEELEMCVGELVCPYRPDPFYAVGAHYRSFDQISDDEVVRILRSQRERRMS